MSVSRQAALTGLIGLQKQKGKTQSWVPDVLNDWGLGMEAIDAYIANK